MGLIRSTVPLAHQYCVAVCMGVVRVGGGGGGARLCPLPLSLRFRAAALYAPAHVLPRPPVSQAVSQPRLTIGIPPLRLVHAISVGGVKAAWGHTRSPESIGKGGKVGGRGGGSGTQKTVYPKWPDQIFPMVNFAFFPRWSLWSGGGGGVSTTPPLQPNGGEVTRLETWKTVPAEN